MISFFFECHCSDSQFERACHRSVLRLRFYSFCSFIDGETDKHGEREKKISEGEGAFDRNESVFDDVYQTDKALLHVYQNGMESPKVDCHPE